MTVPEPPDSVHQLRRRKARLRIAARVTITAAVVTIVCEALTGFAETWPVWIALALVTVGLGCVVVSVALSWRDSRARAMSEPGPRTPSST